MPFDRIQCADLNGWTGDPDAPGWRKVVASVAAADRRRRRRRPRQRPRAVRKLSICVLPFANMSGDPEQEYFSDGISEDIITDLSKVSALSVIARNTAFTFKGKSVEVPQVARAAQRQPRAGGQRAQGRQAGAHHRPADRRRHRRATSGPSATTAT